MTDPHHPPIRHHQREQVMLVLNQLLAGTLSQEQAARDLVALLGRSEGTTEAERLLFARQYDSLSETLNGLVAAIEEFRGISGQTPAEIDKMLVQARRRFAIQLSSSLFEEPFPLDTDASFSASTSIRRLKGRFSRLADAVADLVETTIKDSQLRKELEIAGTVQKMLVPKQVVRVAGLVTHSWYRSAEQCSGDWWTLAQVGSKDALFLLGDVTGHGAPAAIIVGIVRGALEMARLGMGEGLKPFMVMNMLNHILMDSVDGEYFMTAVAMRYQPDTRTLQLANAGHRSPWILSPSGTRPLKGHRSAPLGTSRGQRYQDEQVRLGVGELLVAFTDGLVEARSPDGREFGERALRMVCERTLAEGPDAICAAVRRAVEEHVGDLKRLSDDLTFVVVEAPASA
jgi:phosphoserine phosphatase RsbU/P